MTFTFKLSRRLARLRMLPVLTVLVAAVACAGEDLTEPATPVTTDPTAVTIFPDSATVAVNTDTQFEAEPTIAGEEISASRWRWNHRHQSSRLAITPQSTTLRSGAKQSFGATAVGTNGRPMSTSLTWSATGGKIDNSGRYTAGDRAGKFVVVVKTSGLTDTARVTITNTNAAPPTPTTPVNKVVLTPTKASVKPGGSVTFTAEGMRANGSPVPISTQFTATGGSIASSGKYTAPKASGTYRVVATDPASGKADTSTVSVTSTPTAPTVAGVELTPSSATVKSGANEKFSAKAVLSNGADTAVGFNYSATGGSVSSSGTYTAGTTPGTYRVIAKLKTGDFADTSSVTIPAPPPGSPTPPNDTPSTPAPPPPASGKCDAGGRSVSVSGASELKSALNGAQPGDCITMSAGNYNTGQIVISQSGTSSKRITLTGPRGAVLTGFINPKANYWTFSGFTITGGLWGIYSDPGSWNVYDDLEIHHTQQEAIHLHGASKHNVVQNNYVHNTGTVRPEVGECVYLGSGADGSKGTNPADSNQVLNNRLESCGAEGIDVKEGTTGNIVQGNTITNVGLAKSIGSDAGIAIRGSGARVSNNTISGTPRYSMQVWPEAGWGKDNVVKGNKMSGIGQGYYGIQVRSGYESGTTIGCDNVVSGGAQIANMACK